MRRSKGAILAALFVASVAGCGGPKPGGQVAATVGKREVTVREIQAELGAYKAPDARTMKAAEDAALRNIVGRDLVAEEAHKEGLDKTPEFAIQKQRLIDDLLVQSLQHKFASQVPVVTDADAQKFVDQHPERFAERKIYILDQLQMPRPSDPNLIKALAPLKTFEDIQALLAAKKIPFRRDTAQLDSLPADQRLLDALPKMPPGELFVLPVNQIVTVNQIKDTRIQPVSGPPAVAFAKQYLARERVQQAVQGRLSQIFVQGLKRVKWSKEFKSAEPHVGSPPPEGPHPTRPAPAVAGATSGG